ncbi:MAG: alkaline phosphatase family protein [Marmoricola sp.]
MEQLRESLPASVKLLVVADHGMVDPSVRVDIDEVPHLRSGLTLLGGEARFRHLYCRTGAVEDVRQAWSDYLGDRATIVTREEGVAAGWFGEVDPEVAPRLGDLMVVCGPELAVLSSRDFAIETQLVGMHGAMTDQEMLIPIVVH